MLGRARVGGEAALRPVGSEGYGAGKDIRGPGSRKRAGAPGFGPCYARPGREAESQGVGLHTAEPRIAAERSEGGPERGQEEGEEHCGQEKARPRIERERHAEGRRDGKGKALGPGIDEADDGHAGTTRAAARGA